MAASSNRELLFDCNPQPMYVSDLDTLQFLAVNDAAIKQYGYAREEFLRMNLKDIRPAEDIPRFLKAHSRRAPTITAAGTFRHVKKDGTLIEVEITKTDITWEGRRAQVVVANDITERKRAEEALRESERRFKSIFEDALLGLYRSTPDGRILMANPALCQMLGYDSLEELQRCNSERDFYQTGYDRANFKKQVEEKGNIVGMESVWKRRDGKLIYVLESSRVTRDSSGKVLYYEGSVENITERKHAEEALSAERRLLRTLIDSMPDYIYVKDVDSRFIVANSAVAELMGANTRENLLGKTDFDFFPKELASAYFSDEQAIIRSGNPVLNREERTVDAKGAGKWTSTSKVPLRDAHGQMIGIMGIGRDITPRKESEAQLRLQAAALESAANSVVISDKSGHILWANPAFTVLTGYSLDEAIGKTFAIFNSSKHPRLFFDQLWKTILKGQMWNGEIINRRKDGSLCTMEQTITPVLDEKGEILHFVTIQHDITETKALALQLTQAQKMESVGRLAGGVAHDFNNLLNVIIGYSEMVLEQPGLDARTQKPVEEIKRAGNRAAALTRQLLAFSRQQVLEPKILNLNSIVVETEKMLRRLIGEDIEFQTKLTPDIGSVKADPGQIEQILMNLAVNARDAMPHGGKLTIETAEVELDDEYARHHPPCVPGWYVVVTVTDSGIGMDQDTKAHIFEPFFTTKEVGKGTGLGLATVYGVVKQSGGYVWVYSELGHGSVFKVYLPRVDQPVRRASAGDLAAETLNGSETVLVVEDEESVRILICSILEQNGYTVLAANSPAQALEIARQNQTIHLLLTDVVMPGMNGPAMAKKLEEMRPGLKVLFMSGYSGSFGVSSGLLEDGMLLLQKPFSKTALLQKLREALEQETEHKPD